MTANEILADIEIYEKFDPVKGTVEGKTYVVVPTTTETGKNSDVVINRHITLAHNTTLIFAGGKISGTGTLTGDNTRLIAPITQIFGEDITVDGIWVMDRAYPQWFGARNDISNNEFWHLRVACEAAKSTEENPLTPAAEKDNIEEARNAALKNLKAWKVDSSDAINKAMKLKHAGEVFLPKGEYAICKTLKVPYGIVLRGELADYRLNRSNIQLPIGDYPLGGDTTPDDLSSYYKLGTVIRPLNTNYPLTVDSDGTPITSFDNNFAVVINPNIHPNENHNEAWEQEFPSAFTTIRDQFVQAVATPDDMYCDGKTIINCGFSSPVGCIFKDFVFDTLVGNPEKIVKRFAQDQKEYYAFDLSGLGDNLYFHRNHMNMNEITGGLKLSKSNGAQISCNIINDNIAFYDCKGISFSANHCEDGIQVKISNSQIDFSGNYFHKGPKPTFLIRDNNARGSVNVQSSTITLQNNSLVFLDHEDESSSLYIGNINPYDIQTDGYLSLSIQNTYRYRTPRNAGGSMHGCGLAILKEIWTIGKPEPELIPFTEFNDLSYLLSGSSLIKPNFHIVHNHVVNNTQFFRGAAMANNNIVWFLEKGTYHYRMQTIWDKKRLIGSSTLTLGNFNLGEIGSNPNMGKPQGLLLNIGTNSYDGPSDGNGNQVVIRLMRARTSGNTAYHSIEIPVCGTRFLYDNGLSVCGFKWKQETSIAPLTVNTMIQSIHFVGDNVVCKGTACPTVGEWTVGDIVYNTGTASNNAMWIYTANGWQAR